jgi:hypothetical protein
MQCRRFKPVPKLGSSHATYPVDALPSLALLDQGVGPARRGAAGRL